MTLTARERELSLEVFIDDHKVCLRSFVGGCIPFMEVESDCARDGKLWIHDLEEERFDGHISKLFQGLPDDDLRNPVSCDIRDVRSGKSRLKPFICFNSMHKSNSFESDSGCDSCQSEETD